MLRTKLTASYLPVLAEYGLEQVELDRLSLLRFQRGE